MRLYPHFHKGSSTTACNHWDLVHGAKWWNCTLSVFHPLFCSVVIHWKIYNTESVSSIQKQLHCYCGNKHNTTGTKKWQTQHQKSDDCAQLSHVLLSNKKKTDSKIPIFGWHFYNTLHTDTWAYFAFHVLWKFRKQFLLLAMHRWTWHLLQKKYGLLLQPGSLHLPLFSL